MTSDLYAAGGASKVDNRKSDMSMISSFEYARGANGGSQSFWGGMTIRRPRRSPRTRSGYSCERQAHRVFVGTNTSEEPA